MEHDLDRFQLVCFATPPFSAYRDRLLASARRFDIDAVHVWDQARLQATEFYASNRAILDLKRGAGYWLWKPYIILQALEASEPDAFIIYADAAIEFIGDLSPLRQLLRGGDGILVFQDGRYLQNKSWTKRDTFVLMGCDMPAYWFAPQINAATMAFRNTPNAVSLVREWLAHCSDARVLTDVPNQCALPNWVDFFDHRHDQSVLTNLIVKHGILPHRELSANGREVSIDMEYRNTDGTVDRFAYLMSSSPYGVLSRPDPTRPTPIQPKRSLFRRMFRRILTLLYRIPKRL